MRTLLSLMWASLLMLSPGAWASDETEDLTESPYFEVLGDGVVDRLPLKSTTVSADIAGVVAAVTVTQAYRNEGTRPLEARYVFPTSTRAAVIGLQMRIGDRLISAKIKEKEQARTEYEQAKSEGKSASLLEQSRPNVFTMNVANILPGETIEVTLQYSELLVPEEGTYQFVYPTAMGPKYASAKTPAKDAPAQPALAKAAADVTGTFDLAVRISAGIPIQEIDSPTHMVRTTRLGPNDADVQLAPSATPQNDRDFVLEYRLRGGAIESGVLLGEGGGEQFFMLMMQPPKRVVPEDIPPREYIFIVDVSGSMSGFPIDTAKQLMNTMLRSLQPTDRFNLVLFASGYATFSPSSLPASDSTVRDAIAFVGKQPGSGGTEILPAMRSALALPRAGGMSRTVVLVTDGLVEADAELYDTVRAQLGDANLFVFGPGQSIDRNTLEATARVGYGEALVVVDPTKGDDAVARFKRYVDSPVLTGIKVKFEGIDAYDVEPLPVPDLFAERPLVVIGKYRGPRQGAIVVSGTAGARAWTRRVDLGAVNASARTRGIAALWARRKVQTLRDYESVGADRKADITALGLKYSLATEYTSFIAVDEIVRTIPGTSELVRQPTPVSRDMAAAAPAYSGAMLLPQALRLTARPAVAVPPLACGVSGTTAAIDAPGTQRIRIARGTELYELLLAAAPSLVTCLEGGDEVELRLGRFVIVIGDDPVPALESRLDTELRALLETLR